MPPGGGVSPPPSPFRHMHTDEASNVIRGACCCCWTAAVVGIAPPSGSNSTARIEMDAGSRPERPAGMYICTCVDEKSNQVRTPATPRARSRSLIRHSSGEAAVVGRRKHRRAVCLCTLHVLVATPPRPLCLLDGWCTMCRGLRA